MEDFEMEDGSWFEWYQSKKEELEQRETLIYSLEHDFNEDVLMEAFRLYRDGRRSHE